MSSDKLEVIIIDRPRYDELLAAEERLNKLYDYNVANWEYFDEAISVIPIDKEIYE